MKVDLIRINLKDDEIKREISDFIFVFGGSREKGAAAEKNHKLLFQPELGTSKVPTHMWNL